MDTYRATSINSIGGGDACTHTHTHTHTQTHTHTHTYPHTHTRTHTEANIHKHIRQLCRPNQFKKASHVPHRVIVKFKVDELIPATEM